MFLTETELYAISGTPSVEPFAKNEHRFCDFHKKTLNFVISLNFEVTVRVSEGILRISGFSEKISNYFTEKTFFDEKNVMCRVGS